MLFNACPQPFSNKPPREFDLSDRSDLVGLWCPFSQSILYALFILGILSTAWLVSIAAISQGRQYDKHKKLIAIVMEHPRVVSN